VVKLEKASKQKDEVAVRVVQGNGNIETDEIPKNVIHFEDKMVIVLPAVVVYIKLGVLFEYLPVCS